jgi:hypothetical protein
MGLNPTHSFSQQQLVMVGGVALAAITDDGGGQK